MSPAERAVSSATPAVDSHGFTVPPCSEIYLTGRYPTSTPPSNLILWRSLDHRLYLPAADLRVRVLQLTDNTRALFPAASNRTSLIRLDEISVTASSTRCGKLADISRIENQPGGGSPYRQDYLDRSNGRFPLTVARGQRITRHVYANAAGSLRSRACHAEFTVTVDEPVDIICNGVACI